jgi:hypothetical protein
MAASQFFLPYRPVFDGSLVVPGAQIYFTVTGTNTPSAPFTTSAVDVPQSNPVIADGVGAFPPVYLDAAVTYRVRVYAAEAEVGLDTPLEEYDPYLPGAFMQFGFASGQGYGGTATQATSKVTTVTLNKLCGRITMSSSSIPAGNTYIFNFNNSYIADGDQVLVKIGPITSGLFNYSVEAGEIQGGGCRIALTNKTGGSLAEAVPINFMVLKGALS